MATYDIAIISDDGIGPEVIDAAPEVLESTAQNHGFTLNQTIYDWGRNDISNKGR